MFKPGTVNQTKHDHSIYPSRWVCDSAIPVPVAEIADTELCESWYAMVTLWKQQSACEFRRLLGLGAFAVRSMFESLLDSITSFGEWFSMHGVAPGITRHPYQATCWAGTHGRASVSCSVAPTRVSSHRYRPRGVTRISQIFVCACVARVRCVTMRFRYRRELV